MSSLDTYDNEKSRTPGVKTSLGRKIRQVVVVFSVILLALDIANLVQAANLSCFDVLSPTFQGFGTVFVDILLVLMYSPSRKRKYLTIKRTKPYTRHSYENVLWRFILLIMTLIWPIQEISATGGITLPVDDGCELSISKDSSLGRSFTIMGGPSVADLIPVLKVARARTSVCIAVSVFLAVELRLAYSKRRTLIRRDKALALALPITDAIELSPVDGSRAVRPY